MSSMNQPFVHLLQNTGKMPPQAQTSASTHPVLSIRRVKQINRNNQFQCSKCPKSYYSKPGLTAHFKTIHLGYMFKCTVQGCEKMFSSKQSWSRHTMNFKLHPFNNRLTEDVREDVQHQINKFLDDDNLSRSSTLESGGISNNYQVVQNEHEQHRTTNGGYLKEKTIMLDDDDEDVVVLFANIKQKRPAPGQVRVNLWEPTSAVFFTALSSAVAASTSPNKQLEQYSAQCQAEKQ